jgi:hypothetical protein
VSVKALPGGSADKVNNRYEHWWTAYRVAQILRGEAVSIRLEPPGALGDGVEYLVEERTGLVVEQVKGGGDRWTIERLIKHKVLASVPSHVSKGRNFRLVVAAGAEELHSLCHRSRAALSFAELRNELLTVEESSALARVATLWEASEPDAWKTLRCVWVEHHTQDSVRAIVRSAFEVVVSGDPGKPIDELRSYFDDSLQQVLTGTSLWAFLESRGFRRRLLAGDEPTLSLIRSSLERQIDRIKRELPVIGSVDRSETHELLEILRQADPPQLVLVDGAAGSGKSTMVTNVVAKLEGEGWLVGALRLDSVGGEARTAADLAPAMALADPPPIALAQAAGRNRALLFVDQLDAVSLYSGRIPDVYDAFEDLLRLAKQCPNLVVVAAVRTVDLKNDPRLASLSREGQNTGLVHVGLLSDAAVDAALTSLGVSKAGISAGTREILRLPLHLAMFGRIDDRTVPLRNQADLYERLEAKIRRTCAAKVSADALDRALKTIVTKMSDRETLFVPTTEIDGSLDSTLAALESEGCVVVDRKKISFFHETFFDFLFARTFIASGQDVRDFLVQSGQHLFRRAQARQIIEYLAAHDRERMRHEVQRLLFSDSLRLHLKVVVIEVVRSIPAVDADWRVVEPLAFSDRPLADRILSLLSEPAWFDAIDTDGRIDCWLKRLSGHDLNRVVNTLIRAAKDRPARVGDLFEQYAGAGADWDQRIRLLVGWACAPELVDMVLRVLEAGVLDSDEGFGPRRDFWSLAYPMAQNPETAAEAARLVGAFLRRAETLARESGNIDPFECECLDDRAQMGLTVPSLLAIHAGAAYLAAVLPFVRRVLGGQGEVSGEESDDDDFRQSARRAAKWDRGLSSTPSSVRSAMFSATDLAMRSLATADLAPIVETLRNSESQALQFLACRALTFAGSPDDSVAWLTQSDTRLTLGIWYDNYLASRALLATCSVSCSPTAYDALEGRLLAFVPGWEKGIAGRHSYGRAQHALLSALPESRRSAAVSRRLGEHDRKFGGHDTPRNESDVVFGGTAVSPVDEASAARMRDSDWIQALRTHDSGEARLAGRTFVGGSSELAGVLKVQAQKDPERFIRLALTFDASIPEDAFRAVIDAVAESATIDLLEANLAHAWQLCGAQVSWSIAHAIRIRAKDITDVSVGIIEQLAASAETPARESAAGAAAAVLYARPNWAGRLQAVVGRLAGDSESRVRSMSADAIRALLNHDRGLSIQLAASLFSSLETDDIQFPPVAQLFMTLAVLEPASFQPVIQRALNGGGKVARLGGFAWTALALQDRIPTGVPKEFAALPAAVRVGAIEFAVPRLPASMYLVEAGLDDPDPDVRRQAARVTWEHESFDEQQFSKLIETVQNSSAVEECAKGLIRMLAKTSERLPSNAIGFLENVIQIHGYDLADISTAAAALSGDIAKLTLRLYFQGDEATRTRCLDIVDRLAAIGSYGITEALDDER